jgi:hypothetical protein
MKYWEYPEVGTGFHSYTLDKYGRYNAPYVY